MAILGYQPNSIRASLDAEGIVPADEHPEAYHSTPSPIAIRTMDDYDAMMGEGGDPYMRVFVADSLKQSARGPVIFQAPKGAEETNMDNDTIKHWNEQFDDFDDDLAAPGAPAKAKLILGNMAAKGATEKEIRKRARDLLKTLRAGKMPKQSTTKEERAKPAAQQTLPTDPIGLLRDEAAALRIELAGLEVKQTRLRLLDRVLAAAEEST